MTTITQDSPEFATFPKTIRELISETIAKGGEVRPVAPGTERFLAFYLPRRVRGVNRDGSEFRGVSMRNVGNVGWYVRDGRNKIGASVHDVRAALARA